MRDKIYPLAARHRAKRLPLARMMPNMVTLAALCLGLTALRLGLEERFELAMICIAAASVLDTLDGRLARLLKAESPIGAQLDSLGDFVNFGVVPPMLVYLWALQETGRLGWAVVLLFAVCGALRLARFNVGMDEADRPAWQSKFFTGVPAPAAGILVMLPLYLYAGGLIDMRVWPGFILLYMVPIGLLMVSALPTFSGKRLQWRVRRDKILPIMLAIGCLVALLLTFPWLTLSLFSLVYMATLPLSYRAFRRMKSVRG